MSDTPQVDAFMRVEGCSNDNPVAFDWLVGLARSLERECAELRKKLGWQPISTAPKDGTKILVKKDNGVVAVIWYDTTYCFWSHAGHFFYMDGTPVWRHI